MSSRDPIAEPWGTRTPYGQGEQWPVRVDQHLTEGVGPEDVDRWVRTATLLHSNGDALDIAVKDGRIVGVRGRADDRVNRGRLDPKDLYGWQADHSPDRLTRPLVRRDGKLVETDWDTAMDLVVERSTQLLDEQGASALGFTSGQLFLEEYYTRRHRPRRDRHQPHGRQHPVVHGHGRLSAEGIVRLRRQPGSYGDIDHADVIALYGHNMAETQVVLWTRVLDRLAGPNPPRLLCVDPRPTPVAQKATLHLAPRPGTNVALMNSILHELIRTERVDHGYVEAYTVGYEDLVRVTNDYPPERAAEICGVPAERIREAAALLGGAERLLSTVLQGFYQSNQATAAAVQVNNVHLLRGMLGRPGAGVLQMNGQPSAENTRECGADGDLVGFRNWDNGRHVADLAAIWNLNPMQIPHYAPPTHAMQIMRYAEKGSIRFLWVSATNPLVSLPELRRVRELLASQGLFLVVQDIFLTETAELADVVLPAATWGEKTGTFTNSDRTVHLSEKAVEPPGEARSDLDIFLDYARRIGFRDNGGQPFPQWHDPESAFEAWKRASAGRPCDYSGLSYDRLRGNSGVQWPCDEAHPEGTERLYTDGRFWARPEECESYGKDLVTGAPLEEPEYRAANPDGRAMIKAVEYVPPHEEPGQEYPFALITGRTLYHFHTRTKTGRAPQLQRAAPEVWVEIAPPDAEEAGIREGHPVEIRSTRGRIHARARISGIRPGVLFVPFHYGYWDTDTSEGDGERDRAANEMTVNDWDPVSKQPMFKVAAVQLRTLGQGDGQPSSAPTTTASAPVGPEVTATRGEPDTLEKYVDGGTR